jgi:hypothetical protein
MMISLPPSTHVITNLTWTAMGLNLDLQDVSN